MIYWTIVLALTLITTTVILKPLLQSDSKHSLICNSKNNKQNIILAIILTVLMPVITLILYKELGASTELSVAKVFNELNSTPEHKITVMEQWVKKQPANTQALYLLGSEYMALGLLNKALHTYHELYKITGKHPQASAQLAHILFLVSNQLVTEKIRKLYRESLSLDPENKIALGLQGIDAFEKKRYKEAVKAWHKALKNEKDPSIRKALVSGIDKAEYMLKQTR